MHLSLVILVFCATFSAGTAVKNFRWCTKNTHEEKKCQDFKKALVEIAKIAGVEITPDCVRGIGDEDCMKKIMDNKADFITLDGGKVYQAGKCYKLVPIVAESYGSPDGISYYSVAVARNTTDINFRNLKGKKSCHTGYRRTAGWNIPVGRLLEEKVMENKGSDVKSASEFFYESCVPGVPAGYDNLCKLCPEGSNCSSSGSMNAYSGYNGAFKCMADNKGDVAFVKHLTTGAVLKDDDGKYGNMSDYKYLCTDGTFKVVTNESHESCNFGANPSHAVVGRAGENAEFVKVLETASTFCQPNKPTRNCTGFSIFNSKKYGGSNLLFKDSTKKLVDVKDKTTYEKWLGNHYTKAMEALGNTKCSGPVSGAMNVNPLPALLSVLVFIKAFL